MGDPSALRYVPANSASIPIDWSKVPEASKKFLLKGWGRDWKTDQRKPLPATIGDLANMLNGSKFFGYMDSERCSLLLDIGEFGLTASVTGSAHAMSAGPRFYMKYLDQVWFVLLIPGKREGVLGFGPTVEPKFDDGNKEGDENVVEAGQKDGEEGQNDGEEGQNDGEEGEAGDDDDEEEDKDVEDYDDDYTHTKTEEIAMAQAFDAKLDDEVRRPGILMLLDFTKNLGGWTAFTLKSSLQEAQFADSIMALPHGHPAQSKYIRTVLSSLRR